MKTTKKILCLSMVMILFLQCNYLAFYYSLYEINVKDLTASCCEKKVDNCNAHCFLDKKMNEETDGSQKGLTLELKVKISEFEAAELNTILYKQEDQKYFSFDNIKITSQFVSEIEHPPQV